ncbi:glycosyltransferase [Glaciecola sp. SC05]|uniref:glycosyltransferase n=1 Tax=Glaciecola sp. SC05 TaxID=1987355 RepID=UPI0035275337
MINIAFLHSVAKIGGAERVSQMLMLGLNKQEFTSTLVCPEKGDLSEWADTNGIAFSLLPIAQPGLSNALSSIKQITQWVAWLKTNKIDVIHTADPYCTRAIAIPAKLSGTKVLSHFHFPFAATQLQWLFNNLPKPNVCVFCSEDLQREVGKHLKSIAPSSKLLSIHNGVDVTRFKPTDNVLANRIHIGIVANLQMRKGHDEFIQMASRLVERYDNLHFDIIGGDILEEPREAKLKAMSVELGLKDIISFHGQVPDVLSRLDKLNIVVCASHQEAFPIAILEAMAMQKPIVSTDVNGIPEALEHEESGLLVQPHNAEQLAFAVSRLLDDPDMQRRLAKNARARVVEHFNVSIFVDRFEHLYRDMM